MILSDEEIWEKVKELKNKELLTYVEKEPNFIYEVEDSNNKFDKVLIAGRSTYPTREDILAAYKLLVLQKSLNRKKDLIWLSVPKKKVSSIVFRIIGEITKSLTTIEWRRNEPTLVFRNNNV